MLITATPSCIRIIAAAALCAASSFAAAQFHLRTEPAPLNAPDSLNQNNYNASVAGDGTGNWVAVWATRVLALSTHIVAARSADNGATWSATVELDPDSTADDGFITTVPPTVVTDKLGVWIAIWSTLPDGVLGDRDTFVARSTDNGATWSDPVTLNTPAQVSSPFNVPHLATDGTGNWVAVFTGESATDIGDDVYFARSSDNGVSWSAAVALDDNAQNEFPNYYPEVATDGDGTWIAVWTTPNDLVGGLLDDWKLVAARSTDDGATWTDPAFVSAGTMNDYRPSLATDGADNWVVVWVTADDQFAVSDMMVSRSADDGVTWSPSAPVDPANPGLGSDESSLATDSAGNWVVTWRVTIGGGVTIRNAVSRSSDNGASWTVPEPLAKNGINSYGIRPCLATDGAGRWIGVWSEVGQSTFDPFDIVYTRWTGILEPDRDGDNFSDANESTAGTDPSNWDSDGDNLSDEEEVNTYGTNPLLADTDGDGVWDSIEISLGTDPLDPFDFPVLPVSWKLLAAVVCGMAVIAGAAFVRRQRTLG